MVRYMNDAFRDLYVTTEEHGTSLHFMLLSCYEREIIVSWLNFKCLFLFLLPMCLLMTELIY